MNPIIPSTEHLIAGSALNSDSKEVAKEGQWGGTPITEVKDSASQADCLGVEMQGAFEAKKPLAPFKETNFEAPHGKVTAEMFLQDSKKVEKHYGEEHEKALLEAKGKLDESQPQLFELLNQSKMLMNSWIQDSATSVEARNQKLEELDQEMTSSFPQLIGLLGAMNIIKEAIGYKNAFFKREEEIDKKINKQPFVLFAQTLNERTPTINTNLEKLIKVAEEVRGLYTQRHECLAQAAIAAGKNQSSLQENWVESQKKLYEVIKSRFLYAQQVKEGNMAQAKKTRVRGDIDFCLAQEHRARALETSYRLEGTQARAEGDEGKAVRLLQAANVAGVAAGYFNKAAREGISEQERDAWEQAASYQLERAQAREERDNRRAERLNQAAYYASMAAPYFNKGAQEGISLEERDASEETGSYCLEFAHAFAKGDEAKAVKLYKAAKAAKEAVGYFARAAKEGISLEERDASEETGSYCLEFAHAFAKGDEAKAVKLYKAAKAAEEAAGYFARAAKEGISEQERDAWKKNALYQLRLAEKWASGEDAKSWTYKKYLEEESRKANQAWYQRKKEPGRPALWKGLP